MASFINFTVGTKQGSAALRIKGGNWWLNFHLNIFEKTNLRKNPYGVEFHASGTCPECSAEVHVSTTCSDFGPSCSEIHYKGFNLACEECRDFMRLYSPARIIEMAGPQAIDVCWGCPTCRQEFCLCEVPHSDQNSVPLVPLDDRVWIFGDFYPAKKWLVEFGPSFDFVPRVELKNV